MSKKWFDILVDIIKTIPEFFLIALSVVILANPNLTGGNWGFVSFICLYWGIRLIVWRYSR